VSRRSESGSATVLAVGIVVAMLLLLAGLAPVVVLLGAHQRAAAAADAAALAAADTALGALPGIPCDRAAETARADDARIVRCRQAGTDVRVEVAVSALGLTLPAAAHAGPPGRPSVDLLRGGSDRRVYGVRDRRPAQHSSRSKKEDRARHEEAGDRRVAREGEDDREVPRARVRGAGLGGPHP
jgi:secretion/DNA translocation related TadE-like protein